MKASAKCKENLMGNKIEKVQLSTSQRFQILYYIEELVTDILSTPTERPDLNPIGNLWSKVEKLF